MEQPFVREIVLIFIIALVGGYFALKLRQPTFIGYLLGGFFIALPVFGDFVQFDFSRQIAQFGVALLLFATGLEFPISKLFSVKKTIVISSVLHLTLFILIAGFTLSKFQFSLTQGLFVAATFSNSGTVVILKFLESRSSFGSKLTESIVGWLILQDIAMVVIAMLISALFANGSIETANILEAGAKSVLFISIGLIFGKNVVPKIFDSVSRLNSFELLLILSLGFCLTIGYVAELFGLSYTLGAFFAGVMISESFANHEIFSEIKPIRDIFTIIFFVSLGSLISFSYVTAHLVTIILVVVGLMAAKFLLGFVIFAILEKQTRQAFMISITLAGGGEFAFILAQIGLNQGWIDKDLYSLSIIITTISLLLTPTLMSRAERWFRSVQSFLRSRNHKLYNLLFVRLDSAIDIDQPDIENHVVVCGFGRVGNYIGRALERSNIPFIVIDSNTEVIDYCKQRGIRVVFGDASNFDVLEKADVERAVAVVIALPQETDAELITSNVRKLNENVKIIARSHIPIEEDVLKVKGASITVEPEFEAAIAISKRLLTYYGKSGLDVSKFLKRSRRRQRSKLKAKAQNGDTNDVRRL